MPKRTGNANVAKKQRPGNKSAGDSAKASTNETRPNDSRPLKRQYPPASPTSSFPPAASEPAPADSEAKLSSSKKRRVGAKAQPKLLAKGGQDLIEAAQAGDLEMVKHLLQQGVDTNTELEGITAIVAAAASGHVPVVAELMNAGADINETVRPFRAAYTLLMLAAERGDAEMLSLLLGQGANVLSQDVHGMDALMLAARDGHLAAVDVLLKAGANPHLTTWNGGSALTLATNNHHLNVVRCLLSNGADVNLRTNSGDTALAIAIRQENPEMIRCLVYSGAVASEPILEQAKCTNMLKDLKDALRKVTPGAPKRGTPKPKSAAPKPKPKPTPKPAPKPKPSRTRSGQQYHAAPKAVPKAAAAGGANAPAPTATSKRQSKQAPAGRK